MGLGLIVILLLGQLSDTQLKSWVDAQHSLYAKYRTQVPILGWRPDRSHLFGPSKLKETDTKVIEQMNQDKLINAPDWAGPINREDYKHEEVPYHYQPGEPSYYRSGQPGRTLASQARLLEESGK